MGSKLISFTEEGPWELEDLDALSWRQGLDAVRASAHARIPELVKRSTMPPGGRAVHVAAVLGRAVGLWTIGARRRGGTESRADISHRLRRSFEHLGPTFIKLGQVISSGEGMLPEELVSEFKTLRDRVPAEDFEVVRRTIEEDFGRPLREIFSHFDGAPVAAASIAQVHFATLVTGEQVAVKVQRPGIGRRFERDLAVLAWMVPALERINAVKIMNLPALMDLFAGMVVEELDFRLEAENMIDVAKVLDAGGQDSIVVPRPHPTMVTERVLVMERLSGFAFDDVAGMKAAGVDTSRVVMACLVSLMEGAMIHGVFHGDLHGGNLFIRPDGRVALLDFGITGRLEGDRRLGFLKMMMGSMTGNQMTQVEALQQIGALPPGIDLEAFLREIPQPTMQMGSIDQADADAMMAQMRDMTKSLVSHGMRIPKELMLFVKNFMFIDAAMNTLAPDIDLLGEMGKVSQYFIETHGAQIASDIGLDPDALTFDPNVMVERMGIDPSQGITPREMREQRSAMRDMMRNSRKRK